MSFKSNSLNNGGSENDNNGGDDDDDDDCDVGDYDDEMGDCEEGEIPEDLEICAQRYFLNAKDNDLRDIKGGINSVINNTRFNHRSSL